MDDCVICKKTTNVKDQAMECALCKGWEHVGCVRQSDRLSHELYEALKMCRSKALLYVRMHTLPKERVCNQEPP